MRRRFSIGLAALCFMLGLAASSSAAPILVELRIKDPVGSLDNPSSPPESEFVPPSKGNGKGKSNEKGTDKGGSPTGAGNSGDNGSKGGQSTTKADLKSLSLWLSNNGKDWTQVSSEIVAIEPDKITAQINGKGKDDTTNLFESFSRDITGNTSQSYYVGVSTSSTSFASGSGLSARLISMEFTSKHAAAVTGSTTRVPEPAMWPLFAAGAMGLGLALRSRRTR